MKKEFNCYICPTELFSYIDAVTTCKWYWAKYFPDCWKEGFTEFNAAIPSDIYPLILEKAKEIYLEKTGDETYGHLSEKQAVIDGYTYSRSNRPMSDFPVHTYSCPSKIIEFVKKNLSDSWHSFNMLESDDPAVARFTSTLAEEYFPLVIERSKMDYLSSLRNGCLFVSPKEEVDRGGWLTFTMGYFWHMNFYFMPTDEDLALVEDDVLYGR